MKKLLMGMAMALAFLLTGCDDDGIYGTYKNEQHGLILKISEKSIEFKGNTAAVQSWDNDEKAKTYTAHTLLSSGSTNMKWNMHFKKEGSDVIYLGTLFKKD